MTPIQTWRDMAAMSRIQNDDGRRLRHSHGNGAELRRSARKCATGCKPSCRPPNAAPMVLDLFARRRIGRWPKIAKRLHHMLPPQVQAEEAKEQNDPSLMPPPQPPNPVAEADTTKAQAEIAIKQRGQRQGTRQPSSRGFEALKAQQRDLCCGRPADRFHATSCADRPDGRGHRSSSALISLVSISQDSHRRASDYAARHMPPMSWTAPCRLRRNRTLFRNPFSKVSRWRWSLAHLRSTGESLRT